VTRHPAAEPITDPLAEHGEGPVWWAGWGGLRWVDMLKGDVLELAGDGVRRTHVGSVAAAIRPRRGGGMVVGVERGFALVDPDGTVRAAPEVWTDPSVRMNDGACDPDGRFYCGTMAYDEAPGRGSLYRLDTEGRVGVVLTGVTISNGLAFSPDGATAYYIDTPTHGVDVFGYDSDRGLHDRRRLFSIDPDLGSPDGMTVDAEGCLWVAMHGGAAVLRFHPDGTPDARIDLPVRDVTACTLGGRNLDRLFITTSRSGGDTAPLAGALFVAHVGVPGLPALPYAG
jgi:sugar lactone lactonase YvrE